jgi:hypothetical protein
MASKSSRKQIVLEMNNTVQDISVPEVGSIHNAIRIKPSQELLPLRAVNLFLRIVGS